MATRRERVVLELEDGLSGPITKDAAAVALLKRELNDLDRTSVRTGRSTESTNRSIKGTGTAAGQSGRDIDRFSGRLRVLADAAAILGPGLIPIGAVGIPAVAGLAAQMGAAAIAGGTLVAAFQGVGDAIKTVNEAAIDPSAANLEAARLAMSKLGPEARDFVTEFQQIRPVFDDLRDAAAAGWFPGLTEALTHLEDMAPRIADIFEAVGSAGGSLVAEGAESLAGPRWADFLSFVETEVPSALTELGHTVGNLAHGLAELWQAFTPLNQDFSGWLLDVSESFDDWAQGLSQTQGFQDFIDYVRDAGPQVADTMGALANAVLDVVEAAAPLGGTVLKAIEAIARAVSVIMDSDMGTPIMGAVTAMALFNRAAQVMQSEALVGWRANISGANGAIAAMGTARDAATRAAAGVGMIALSMTDLDDKAHLSNAAMGAMVGTMVAPGIGTGIGAAAGFMLDLADAAGRAADATEKWRESFGDAGGNIAAQNDVIAQAREQYNAYVDDVTSSNVGEFLANSFDPTVIVDFTKEAFGYETGSEQQKAALDELEARAKATREAGSALGDAFGQPISTSDYAGLTDILERATPAMEALGYSVEDLQNASPDELRLYADVIADWTTHADSAAGRTEAFAKSVEDLGNDALSTADSATQMGAALEALLSPTLTAEQATDAWRQSLQQLQKELKSKAGFEGFSKGALENRQITRDYVTDSMARLTALAGLSTTTEGDMARAVAQTRQEFIRSGIAAGFSREAMVKRANALKLTPKLVKTVFEAAGITEVDLRARRVRETFESMPKRVQTDIKANGIPETVSDVNKLVEKYHLSEKQRTALITLKDLASQPIGKVLEKLGIVDRSNPSPTVSLNGASGVTSALAGISSWLGRIDGTRAVTTVETHHIDTGMGPQSHADGGTILGPRRPYGDKIHAFLAPGEEVISNRFGQADRHRQLLKAINANRYADGGTVNGWAGRSSAGGMTHRSERVERVVERLPRTLVLDAGNLGRMVIDTVEGRIEDAALMNAEIGRAR